jgi:hypothetical protein
MHFAAGKSVKDEQYAEVNSQEMYDKDKATLMEYVQNQLKGDLEKLIVGLVVK